MLKISKKMTFEEHSSLHSKGRMLSDVTKSKLAKAHIGLKASLETKLKMSSSRTGNKNPFYGKGIKGENHPNFGKKASDKTKANMKKSVGN